MEEISGKGQLQKVRDYEKGLLATHIIRMGAKLGILDVLQETPEGIMIGDLSSRLGLAETYMKTWCETAYHFEILDCDGGDRFRFAPFMGEILGDSSSMRYYMWNNALTVEVMGKAFYSPDMGEMVRSGEMAPSLYPPELSEIAGRLTQNIYLAFVYMIFPEHEYLKQRLEEGAAFLDVGCGWANLICQLAQIYPASVFAGVDPDTYAIEAAKKKISDSGLEGRVSVDMAFDAEFDMVSMVVTLHEILPEVRLRAIEKAFAALKSGGHLIVLDFPYPNRIEDFRDPAYSFAIYDQFFERFLGIVHLTNEQRDAILLEAGFSDLQKATIGKGMFELVIAQKA
jgi:ubiquinone/menaquinone biosynthesis C-methylase UbiE